MQKTMVYAIAVLGFAVAAPAQTSGDKPKAATKPTSLTKPTRKPGVTKKRAAGRESGMLDETPPENSDWPPRNLTNAKEVLKYAAKAMEPVRRVHYELTLKGTGALASKLGTLWGTMMLDGYADDAMVNFRMMIKGKIPGPSNLDTAMVGSNGKVYFLIDVKNKTVTDSYDRAVMGDLGPILPYFALTEFVNPARFTKEMGAEKLEFLGTEEINKIPCYHVRVSNSDGTEKTDWYFSIFTLLPERVAHVTIDASGTESGTQMTFGPITFNPATMNDPFVSFMPKGEYTRVGPQLVPSKKRPGKKKKQNAKTPG